MRGVTYGGLAPRPHMHISPYLIVCLMNIVISLKNVLVECNKLIVEVIKSVYYALKNLMFKTQIIQQKF